MFCIIFIKIFWKKIIKILFRFYMSTTIFMSKSSPIVVEALRDRKHRLRLQLITADYGHHHVQCIELDTKFLQLPLPAMVKFPLTISWILIVIQISIKSDFFLL